MLFRMSRVGTFGYIALPYKQTLGQNEAVLLACTYAG
jgi:hypothetical protein